MADGLRLASFDEVTSTNALIKDAARSGEPEGLAVIAKTQRAGYGQRGNHWDSPLGGIYLSLLLRPDRPAEQVKEMGQVAAVAVTRALGEFLETDELSKVSFKWPNDIIVLDESDRNIPDGTDISYKKLCGISTELKDGALCLGIGINGYRNREADDSATDGRNRLVYVEDLSGTFERKRIDDLARSVAEQAWNAYEEWLVDGFEPYKDEYSSRLRAHDLVHFNQNYSATE